MHSLIGRRNAARALAAVVGIISIQACASGRHAANGDVAVRPLAPRASSAATLSTSSRITSRELQGNGLVGVNALEAVRRLRPEYLMLTPRPLEPDAPQRISVYQDGIYFGDAELLSLIPIDQVVEIRRLTETRARQLFGWRCPCVGGVITVQTQR